MVLETLSSLRYVIVENAGMEDEYVAPRKFISFDKAIKYRDRKYTKEDIEEHNIDVCLQYPDGTITTEF